MASKHHDDWQSSKETVLQRNTYMFDNELMSDVSFTCGESSRLFHAHKYVLATSSAVFYAMFYGDLAQKEPTICLTDSEEESFEEFLRFLYTDDCKITAENAIGVLYLAKKYLISSLAEKCCKVLEASIAPETVFAVLEQAMQFDEKDLEIKCWLIVSEKTLECTNSEAFCNIGSQTLNTLLKRNTLAIAEVDLFKAVLRWTDNECARQGMRIEDDKMARRRVLGDSVYEIRFLEMSEKDFATITFASEILTDAEVVSIFRKFNGLDVDGFKWKDHRKKRRQSTFCCSRFEPVYASKDNSRRWNYIRNLPDVLTVVVSEAVMFHGVRLIGGTDGSEYNVTFAVKDELVTGTYISERDKDGVWGYDFILPTPISLHPHEEFTIIATIQGPPSLGGLNGKLSVKDCDVVVNFKDPPSSMQTNGTDKNRGQFYKLFLSFV